MTDFCLDNVHKCVFVQLCFCFCFSHTSRKTEVNELSPEPREKRNRLTIVTFSLFEVKGNVYKQKQSARTLKKN